MVLKRNYSLWRTVVVNLSIKNVPEHVVDQLRERAKQNHRSLQGELLSILEQTVKPKKLSVEEAITRIKALNFSTASDSVEIIRELRDGR